MKCSISSSHLSGSVTIPASKSHTLRAILFGLLAKGTSIIHKYLPSPDATAMIDAIILLGAKVNLTPNRVEITGVDGNIQKAEDVIQSGNSGQVLRFIGAIAALSPTYTVVTGDYSIRHNRPIKPLLQSLSDLGAFTSTTRLDDYAPILIKGPIKGGKTTILGHDSQPISGLLIASAFSKGKKEIFVEEPGEKPWIDLTLDWFSRLAIPYENAQYEHYTIPGGARIEAFEYEVPGDFSSAAFPIVAALITNSSLTLHNIDMNDIQGDKKLIHTLIEMGANIHIHEEKKTLTIEKESKLIGMTLDVNDYIDAITILAVVGCYAEGTTRIINAEIARKKECDRIHSIATELKRMGADITEQTDGLIVHKSPLIGAHVHSYHDHRMVMSLAVAALGAKGETVISDIDCIKKTYPTFVESFQKIGAKMEILA